jgi:hypothetical protein
MSTSQGECPWRSTIHFESEVGGRFHSIQLLPDRIEATHQLRRNEYADPNVRLGPGRSCGDLAGCSASSASEPPPAPRPPFAVGVLIETFVDHSRVTPANGDEPELPDRTLVTTIWSPATGGAHPTPPTQGAAPDRTSGPYSLIVFGHGLGAAPEVHEGLLSRWAAAGLWSLHPAFRSPDRTHQAASTPTTSSINQRTWRTGQPICRNICPGSA